MKWAITHSTDQLRYWKIQQDEFTAELKYNNQAKSFRLTADDKRLFFIEKTGFLQSKFLLKTEYSVITGEVYPDKNWHTGIIIFDHKKFNYALKENLLALSSRKANFLLGFEVDNVESLHQMELFALTFSTLKITLKSVTSKTAHAIA